MSKSAHALVFCCLFSYTVSLVSLGETLLSFSISMLGTHLVSCCFVCSPFLVSLRYNCSLFGQRPPIYPSVRSAYLCTGKSQICVLTLRPLMHIICFGLDSKVEKTMIHGFAIYVWSFILSVGHCNGNRNMWQICMRPLSMRKSTLRSDIAVAKL